MLSISVIKSVSHALSYYEMDNYYTRELHKQQSMWYGKGADFLKFSGAVTPDVFARTLQGLVEDGFESARQNKRDKEGLSFEDMAKSKEQCVGALIRAKCSLKTVSDVERIFKVLSDKELGGLLVEGSVEKYEKNMFSSINKEEGMTFEEKKDLKNKVSSSLEIFKKSRRRFAYDLTFSAPKSVSLAALLGGDRRLLECHRQAVLLALGVMEKEYAQFRGTEKISKKRTFTQTGNILSALFEHDVSRKVDPQLHTHCVVMNRTLDSENSWKSLFPDGFYYNSKKLGVVYQNELARLVKGLGYEITPHANGTFDLTGYTTAQLRAFSKRSEQLEQMGAKTQKQKTALIMVNRDHKNSKLDRADLIAQWHQVALDLGIEHPQPLTVQQHRHQRQQEEGIEDSEKRLQEIGKNSLDDLTTHEVSFSKEELQVQLLSKSLGQFSYEFVRDCGDRLLETSTQSIDLRSRKAYVPNVLRDKERDFIAIMETGQKKVPALMEVSAARSVIKAEHQKSIQSGHKDGLTDGQKEALEAFLSTTDQVSAWQGVAGAGKSFALGIAAQQAQERGYLVRGFAAASQAAQVLGEEARLSKTASIASLLLEEDQDPGSRSREIWVIDEAGLVSAVDAYAVLVKAQKTGARVVFVGDTRQLSSVGAGNPFKQLQSHGMQTAYLEQGQRQKSDAMKTIVDFMADKNHKKAMELLDQSGKLHSVASTEETIHRMAQAYLDLENKKDVIKKTLFIASTHYERTEITQLIRSELKKRGDLTDGVSLKTLVSLERTKEALKFGNAYKKEDIVIFHKATHVFKSNHPYKVESVDVDKDTIMLRDDEQKSGILRKVSVRSIHCGVYKEILLDVCVGERLKWTKNHPGTHKKEDSSKSQSTTDRRLNGKEITVIYINKQDKKCVVENEKGMKEILDLKSSHFMDYDYVSTVFSSQGKTCDKVIASLTRVDMENVYVAISRAKYDCLIYTKDKQSFLNHALKSGAKLSAEETLKPAQVQKQKNDRHQEKNADINRGFVPEIDLSKIDLTKLFQKIEPEEKNLVRMLDPSAYLESQGFVVKKEGIHASVHRNGDEMYRFTHKDGTYVSCDRYGNSVGDNISLVRDVEPGLSFVEAVERLQERSQFQSSIAQLQKQTDVFMSQSAPVLRCELPQLPQQKSIDEEHGRRYLMDRGIDFPVIKKAEKDGMLRYTDKAILFVGYDKNGVVQNITRRAIDPKDPIQKRDFRGSDKQYSQILKGNPESVWIVEGGADALALQSMAHRDHLIPPTVLVSGGSNVRSFLENSEIQALLKNASKITVALENEKDPQTQEKTDAEHDRQIARIKQITTAEVVIWKPELEKGKDLADMNFKQQETSINQRKQRVFDMKNEQKLRIDGPGMRM